MIHIRFLTPCILQRMNDLQTIAFESFAYDPVTYWNGSKQELEEVKIQEKGGYRKQDFADAAPGLNIL